jgi:hypothetical protein
VLAPLAKVPRGKFWGTLRCRLAVSFLPHFGDSRHLLLIQKQWANRVAPCAKRIIPLADSGYAFSSGPLATAMQKAGWRLWQAKTEGVERDR